jgi:hypothetical protein
MRIRVLLLAMLLLAIIPAAANAAPKKVRIGFSTTSASVNENAGTFNLRVQRSGNTRVTATVNLAVDPASTAVAGTHYSFAGAGLVTFNPGETSKTLPVTIIDDGNFNSPNRKIVFRLSAPSPGGTMLQRNPETVTILDNDGPGTIDLSAASYSVIESAGFATVSVTRNGNPMLSVSVDYATSDGSATAGSDYTDSSGTVTFGVGETTKTFQVPVNDDQDFEGDESLNVTLSNPQNLTNPAQAPNLGPNSPAPLTIVDDDVPTFAFSAPTYSASENDGTATITVNRGGATYVPASVDYRVDPADPGTATGGGTDYTLANGTLNFAAGETSKTFTINLNDDSSNEGNETVNLQLRTGTTTVDSAQLSIVDDDNPLPSVQFEQPDYGVGEAATTATVTVTLSKQSDSTVTVDYATADGSATNGAAPNSDGSKDYVTKTGTLTFDPGQTSKTIDVTLNPDTVVEDDEDFTVALTNPTNAAAGAPSTTDVTIADDDDFGLFELSKQRYDVGETDGHVTVTVNRVGGSGGDVTVDYATSDGSATAPADYAATSGTLTFLDGETSHTFDIPMVWDGRPEGDESLSVGLSNPGGGADLGTATTSVVHIADDGASAPVAFSAGSYDVSETAGNATLTVNRGGGSLGGPVTVDYAGTDGTSGTLTFAAGEATRSFQVAVPNDNVHTGTRTVTFTLSNPGGGTSVGNPASAALNIADDEPASSPSIDRTAPTLTISAKKLQKALKTKKLIFKVKSNEAAALKITAKIRKGKGKKKKVVVIKKASKRVAAGKTVKVTLRLNKKQLRTLRMARVKGKVKVTLSVKGTDVAKNSATRTKTVTVK